MTDSPDIHPDRAKLNALVEHCEKRARRAGERLRGAEAECEAAVGALRGARDALATWIEANPDPQMELI